MTATELYKKIDAFCPKELSCSWDNDGIMASCDLSAQVRRVLISLDATFEAVDFAAKNGFDTLVTHHPMLFRGAKNVTPETLAGRRIIRALSSGVTVMSFHTRLDACDGGVNDALLNKLGFVCAEKFGDSESRDLGRIAQIEPMTAGKLALLVKIRLGCDSVRLNGRPDRIVTRVGVCGGDGKDFIYPALSSGCDAFITGDAGYNMAGDAQEEGIITIEAGHYHTEVPVLEVLERLVKEAAGDEVECSFFDSCTYSVI
ncbi:MAG: Nif3-like dinuclear metal center hexameric protein [Eubacteriales bacterium]